MDGPKDKKSASSNSSDLSLPPPPTTHNTDRSPPKRPPGQSPPPPTAESTVRQQNNTHTQFQVHPKQEDVKPTAAPTATEFQAIEAHPVSQAGPVIGPYVQRAQTLSTETEPVTAIPKPSETQASWQATSEEMTHVIPTTSTATTLSAIYGLPSVGTVPQSQSVAPSDPKATMAHSEVIHTPQLPVRSGSSLSTSAEISNSVVKVNPQLSLRPSSHKSEQQVQQDTNQFRYQTDQGYHYLHCLLYTSPSPRDS